MCSSVTKKNPEKTKKGCKARQLEEKCEQRTEAQRA